MKDVKILRVTMLVILGLMLVTLLASCGKGGVEGDETVRVIYDTIKCSQDRPNVCRGDRVSCARENYYSDEWVCTVVLERDL